MRQDERILFVDDEKSAREAFASSLKSLGFHIDLASGAEEALSLASRHQYTVIVSDLRMPGANGLSVIERLRVKCPWATYLLVTAAANLGGPIDSSMVDGIVAKPWSRESLSAAIREAVQLYAARAGAEAWSPQATGDPASAVLLIEDKPGDKRAVSELLTNFAGTNHRVIQVNRLGEALRLIEGISFKAVLVDIALPDARGLESVGRLHAAAPSLPIIVLAAMDDESVAVQALQVGAQDYLLKGLFDAGLLNRALRYAIERKESEEKLTRLAYYDQLTALANRRLFHERLSLALARAKRRETHVTVLLLNLDRFKSINESFGYQAGDALLKEVGNRLKESVRESETLARLGGDEFAIILDDLKQEQEATVVAQRVLDTLASPFRVNGQEAIVTGSMGIAFYPENGDTIDQLLKCADSAMYRSKEGGRNSYQIFSKEMHSEVLTRMSLEKDLRHALERNEFRLHYQPQLSLEDNELLAVEALVRWEHADRGLIAPMDFIHLLEDSGLIITAGEWILRTACEQVREWQIAGFNNLRVAVNLSPRQFEDKNLVQVVGRALEDFQLAPQCLELEITESHLMQDTERTKATLAGIKSLGVRIALDDFGTGYSSLTSLRRFPIDSLKIDTTFVRDITTERDDVSIAAGIIGLGHKLRLDVIAEGVETEEQLAFLYKEGCDAIQGYLCGRPQPADVLPRRI
ncbi:MAG: EAL domain-containing protein [Vicinamibacteria bacterium]